MRRMYKRVKRSKPKKKTTNFKEIVPDLLYETNLKRRSQAGKRMLICVERVQIYYPFYRDKICLRNEMKDKQKKHFNDLLRKARAFNKQLDSIMESLNFSDYKELVAYLKMYPFSIESNKTIDERTAKHKKSEQNYAEGWYRSDFQTEKTCFQDWVEMQTQFKKWLERLEYHRQRINRKQYQKPKQEHYYELIWLLTRVFDEYQAWEKISSSKLTKHRERFIYLSLSTLFAESEKGLEGTERFTRIVSKAHKNGHKYVFFDFIEGQRYPAIETGFPHDYKYY